MTFGIIRYAGEEGPRLGVQVGDVVADAVGALAPLLGGTPTMQAVLDWWDDALPILTRLAEDVEAGRVRGEPARALHLLAPLPRPVNLFCAFANYVDHMREMGGEPADKSLEDPFLFMVPVTAVTDPNAAIELPAGMDRTDWEGELAAVIGREGRDLTPEDALSCVAGYTIVHDVSIRGGARRGTNGGRPDFVASKGRSSFKPMGPAIVPAGFVPEPQALAIRTWVNGELKQDSSTAQMIFSVAEQISFLSRVIGLNPGDVIATGTPAGVGMPKGTFLKAGDLVEIEIEGIGRLRNPVVQRVAALA